MWENILISNQLLIIFLNKQLLHLRLSDVKIVTDQFQAI